MNDNHLTVCGQRVAIGPMLAHIMLSSQALQDCLLGLAGQSESIRETHFPVAETGGVLTLELAILGGFPSLMVSYIDDTYTATFEHIGGDSIETLQKTFDDECGIIDWFSDVTEPSQAKGEMITLPFADRFGDYTRVKLTEVEAKPVGDGTWIAEGDVWTDHLHDGLQRETEAKRKAA